VSGPDHDTRRHDDLVRNALGIGSSVPVRSWHVSRLAAGGGYRLLVYGEPGASIGVGAIEDDTDTLLSTASLPGTADHVLVDRDDAASLFGARADDIDLVWWSSSATRSPLYPVWQIAAQPQAGVIDILGDRHRDVAPRSAGG
jgi:hypothetical protein